MLVNGVWTTAWTPYQNSSDGRFVRQSSTLRHWITPDGQPGPTGEGGFPAEAGRYHLYVALICPWASRTLMVRSLKRLESLITVSVVSPVMTEQGWRFGGFPGATTDHLHGFRYLHQLYSRNDPHYTGRASVPVLWDKQRNRLVNNESADIIRMLNGSFAALVPDTPDLCPEPLQHDLDTLNAFYYEKLNNGVYRAGFATSQSAYEEAYADVFAALDELEERLGQGGPYVLGEALTEVDIRLFVTLVRFDSAYYGLFKCNRRRIVDYQRISHYLERIYRLPTIAETVDLDHIRHGYYSVRRLNPNGIVPLGPENSLLECAVNG